MFKLVVIGGKLRGREFILNDGDNVLGRGSECDVYFPVEGISKRHLSITITNDTAYLKDLESANGTFLNGAFVKNATLKNGDKISLPDSIIQVVLVKEKKIIIHKKITQNDDDFLKQTEPVPTNLPLKIIYYFKLKIMPLFYNINREYEWKILLAIIMAMCVFVSITLTIFPVLSDSKRILIDETSLRGSHYADEIARINAGALSKGFLDQIDTNFLEHEPGVVSYELFDLEGRIFRPIGKMNEFIDDPFSVKAKNWARDKKKINELFTGPIGNGQIGIAKKIRTYNMKTGDYETIAAIAIRFSPTSLALEASKSSRAYFESLSTSILVAIFFYGIILFLTIKPMDEMKRQIDEFLRGKRKLIESEFLMQEMNPLRDSINVLLTRIRELSKDESDKMYDEIEEDTLYVEKLINFSDGSGVPTIVLNSEKNIKKINLLAEDLTGIRESSALDMNLLDTAREKGFAAMLIELCDESANNGGINQHGAYDIQGNPYSIHVNTLMGKDNFAKAFYITFINEQS
ncbi:MAG: hypothetical protein A2202_01570 [Bdellovibrionales bacterium RIFOXYA1_FULL_36_14]|nr:MAG: hypothetical protein A2202_01570 [Bdellovibrionales bacterium RIFOXYA1_FULL_36_14]